MNVSDQSINRMNTLETPWSWSGVPRGLAALVLAIGIVVAARVRADPLPPPGAPPPKKQVKPKNKKLTGPELYAIHCNRCHPERYSPERTDAQWQTILLHMRVRANLPAEQARTILKFLQEDSGK
jgi:hypothetical protein